MSGFYEVFKECKKFVLSKEFQPAIRKWLSRPPLDGFGSVGEILAFLNQRFNRACIGEIRRQNAILRQLLVIHQEHTAGVGLEPLFLVIFQPALQQFFRRYRWIDPAGDDLGQVIFSAFLEVLKNYSLEMRPEKIALNIVLDVRHQVTDWISKQKAKSEMETLEDEELPETEPEVTSNPEDALNALIDLARGFGYDETTDRLCSKINHLHKKGLLNNTEKKILIARLIYQESLQDLVPEAEYEKWKKQMQRLIPKILA